MSYAPVDEAALSQLRTQLAGWNGDPEGLDWGWHTVGGYLDRIDQGSAVNAAYLVPHGTVRLMCVGNADRPADADELDAMRAMLAAALEQGAVGMSSGLTYTPGMYADADELIALCRVVGEYGGYHGTHHRSYGRGALEAYEEMIHVAEASGCPVHLTHATLNFPTNSGRAPQLLDLVDAAAGRGVDVTLDTYPYLPAATTLAALLPSWAAVGGPAALAARLRDPAARDADGGRPRTSPDRTAATVCRSTGRPSRSAGRANRRIRRMVGTVCCRGRECGRSACRRVLLRPAAGDDLGTSVLMHIGNEENVRAIMRHSAHLVGSDGLLVGDRPHPRAFGAFARYLGHYVREEGLLSWRTASRR